MGINVAPGATKSQQRDGQKPIFGGSKLLTFVKMGAFRQYSRKNQIDALTATAMITKLTP
jgi:hypothetical protein